MSATSTIPGVQSKPSVSSPSLIQRHPLTAYFIIAFLGTWAAVIPLALSAGVQLFAMPDAITLLLFVISPYVGPMLAAVIVTRSTEGGAGVRQLLKRIVQWRVGPQWYLAAVFSGLLIWLAAYSIFYNGMPLQALLANPALLMSVFLPAVLTGIFIPSIGEEVGWRGFALPRLQARYGPVLGALVLGLLHSLWHFPAFFTPFLGPVTLEGFVAFVLTGTAATFLYSWIFNGARGSVLIAILMHASFNAAAQMLGGIIPEDMPLPAWAQSMTSDWINVIAFGVVAVVLIVATRGKLGYRKA